MSTTGFCHHFVVRRGLTPCMVQAGLKLTEQPGWLWECWIYRLFSDLIHTASFLLGNHLERETNPFHRSANLDVRRCYQGFFSHKTISINLILTSPPISHSSAGSMCHWKGALDGYSFLETSRVGGNCNSCPFLENTERHL